MSHFAEIEPGAEDQIAMTQSLLLTSLNPFPLARNPPPQQQQQQQSQYLVILFSEKKSWNSGAHGSNRSSRSGGSGGNHRNRLIDDEISLALSLARSLARTRCLQAC